MNIEVISHAYQAGLDEEGRPFIAESFGIWATAASGRRFEHDARFRGCVVELVTEESGETWTNFRDVRESAFSAAQRLADRIARHLDAGGILNRDHWGEIDPVYGSEAYVAQDIEELRWQAERAEAA